MTALILNSVYLHSQVNDSLICKFQELGIPEHPRVYENKETKIVKNYFEEYKIVDNHFITKPYENSFLSDTISIDNPLEKAINYNDKLIKESDFEIIELKEKGVDIDSNKIFFQKHVDFIGDSQIDKIEITENYSELYKDIYWGLSLYQKSGDTYSYIYNCSCRIGGKPLKIYISDIKILGMSVIMLTFESEINNGRVLLSMIYSDRIEQTHLGK